MNEKAPVCVVGCSGFIGSHVTATLLERGYSVHGTLRDASDERTHWLRERVASRAKDDATLTFFSAQMNDPEALTAAMKGCDGVFMCAGTEKQAPETIEIMLSGVRTILQTARSLGIKDVVLTSSTGSTNPPGPEPNPKVETDHWSDPMQQLSVGKFSPAAKTLMEALALRLMEESEGALRVCIMNPSLVAGPVYQPELVMGMKFLRSIIKKERWADSIPNGSMSVIDVRDLAMLHVKAYENKEASGRYFGVKKSWSWRDILSTLSQVYPAYTLPDVPEPEEPAQPTQFDLSRQETLGVSLRDLPEILEGVIDELTARGELS